VTQQDIEDKPRARADRRRQKTAKGKGAAKGDTIESLWRQWPSRTSPPGETPEEAFIATRSTGA